MSRILVESKNKFKKKLKKNKSKDSDFNGPALEEYEDANDEAAGRDEDTTEQEFDYSESSEDSSDDLSDDGINNDGIG